MTPKQEVQAIVSKYFDGNERKILEWWNTPNPLLGEMTPIYFAPAKGLWARKAMDDCNAIASGKGGEG